MKVFKNVYQDNLKGVIVVAANSPKDANYLCSHHEATKDFFQHMNPLTFTELESEDEWWSYNLSECKWVEIADWDFITEPCILFDKHEKSGLW